MSKIYPLSLDSDTFNSFKTDFDQMLRQLLMLMEDQENDDASITMKMDVKLKKSQVRDYKANGYDANRYIITPTFKHSISTVVQVKNKKTGTLGGMEMVWDKKANRYVLMPIDDGQVSLYDDEDTDGYDEGDMVAGDCNSLPAPEPLQLPSAENSADDDLVDLDIIDADTVGENDSDDKGECPDDGYGYEDPSNDVPEVV